MSRTITIENVKDWRAGDHAAVVYPNGTRLEGTLTGASRTLWLSIPTESSNPIRSADGFAWNPGATVIVTRDVPDIPEPKTLGAVAQFEKSGSRAIRVDGFSDGWIWEGRRWTWASRVQKYGPAVRTWEHDFGEEN